MATQQRRIITYDGVGGDYTTLSSWEFYEATDLVTPDYYMEAVISGTWPWGPELQVTNLDSAWTTSPSCYISIWTTGASRHSGLWDTGKWYVSPSNTSYDGLTIQVSHVKVNGLQYANDSYSSVTAGIKIGEVVDDIYLTNCIVSGNPDAASYNFGYGATGVSNSRFTGVNLVAFNCQEWGFLVAGFDSNNTCTGVLVNCNAMNGNGIGYAASTYSTVIVKNCLAAYNGGNNFDGTFNSASTHNSSDDSTTPAQNTYYRNQNFVFVDTGIWNYSLQSSDTGAMNKGTNLSSISTIDISDYIRDSTWTIGAYEYPGGGSAPASSLRILSVFPLGAYFAGGKLGHF
jgi:hypothetical protein